jgi:hypothetical protein
VGVGVNSYSAAHIFALTLTSHLFVSCLLPVFRLMQSFTRVLFYINKGEAKEPLTRAAGNLRVVIRI